MEPEELKRKLMGLWEKTTHIPKDLLSSLFDFYFNTDYIEYKEIEGKVVCALIGIPYTFKSGSKKLNGMYMVSLSSEEGFRKKGILSELLSTFNNRIKSEFDFTFIIPATELLADYYGTQGYINSFFVIEERFTPLHNFKNDYYLSLTDSDERIRQLKEILFEQIEVIKNKEEEIFDKDKVISFIREIEKKSTSSVSLCHTQKDLEYILDHETIPNLDYFISHDSDDRITGVTFFHKDEMKRISIVATYVDNTASYYALLNSIKKSYPEYSISIYTSDPKFQVHSIIQQTYASTNIAGGDLDTNIETIEIPFNINKLMQPIGMIKLLRFEKILNFIAETRSDVNFKLHLRNTQDKKEEASDMIVYIVKNGKLNIVKTLNISTDSNILNLTEKEFSELLLRKNDSSNLIMEAFGIPRLNLQIKLLPY